MKKRRAMILMPQVVDSTANEEDAKFRNGLAESFGDMESVM